MIPGALYEQDSYYDGYWHEIMFLVSCQHRHIATVLCFQVHDDTGGYIPHGGLFFFNVNESINLEYNDLVTL